MNDIVNKRTSIDEYLPKVLNSQSISEKVADEVKQHHRWMGVIFHYSEHFSRLFRVISLATSVIIMLFMQSLTYNLTNPDDGSCKLITTKVTCLAALSPYATGEPKCRWTCDSGSNSSGSCSFIEPDSSIKIVLFVAIFSAIISTPIAILSDVIMQYIISAPISPSEEVVSGKRSTIHQKVLHTFTNWRATTINSVLKTDIIAKSEMDSLSSDIQVYREELTASERSEFDSKLFIINLI